MRRRYRRLLLLVLGAGILLGEAVRRALRTEREAVAS